MQVKFVLKDVWVGLYFDTQIIWGMQAYVSTTYYLCILPCLPIIWTRQRTMGVDEAKVVYCKRYGNSWVEKSWVKRELE